MTGPVAETNPRIGYEHTNAYDQGYLTVSDVHALYYKQYGKQDGKCGELIFTKVAILPLC